MAIFDPYITSVTEYIEELTKKDRQVRERLVSSDLESLANLLPSNVVPGASSSIVLKSDTFLELGSPAAGSCTITLYTDTPGLLTDGRITLIGSDVKESPAAQLPFGQVIMLGGKQLSDDDYHQLRQYQHIADQIEGYMVKSTAENIWSRISHEAARKGFSFEVLGAALIRRIKAELPKVESVEVLFVTSNKEDVLELHKIGKPVDELARNIKEKIWRDRGIDITQCNPGGHCGSCKDKTVCNDIKKMGIERRKMQ